MTITKRLLIALLALCGVFFSLKWHKKSGIISRTFTKIPVRFFPISNRPSIDIEIEGKVYSCLVDLGSFHSFDLRGKYINQIINKRELAESKYADAKGAIFTAKKYTVPKVKIENDLIEDSIIHEEKFEFITKDSKHWRSLWNRLLNQIELLTIQGRVGWTVFQKVNCLFDFPHFSIFCLKDIPSSLKDIGYSIDEFASVSFKIENCGIVLAVETKEGIKKLCLDTGTTHSVMRKPFFKAHEKIQTFLKIGNQDFGNWHFRSYDLSEMVHCDGILGVDFFKKHVVCFDFHNQVAYIKPFAKKVPANVPSKEAKSQNNSENRQTLNYTIYEK